MGSSWLYLGSILALVFMVPILVESCNEAVCASVVSKCMLTQSCKCELKNCSCCKECSICLKDLYTECCSCVDLCPKPTQTLHTLGKKSHVEDLSPTEVLFKALTEAPDELQRWLTFTYPVDLDVAAFSPKLDKEIKYETRTGVTEQEVSPIKDNKKVTLNCTVAYQDQCMSWNKCRDTCQSMGAASYRWFHDGCCECIGSTCINYGINESRCESCPLKEGEEDPLDEETFYHVDYDNNYGGEGKGEDNGDQDIAKTDDK